MEAFICIHYAHMKTFARLTLATALSFPTLAMATTWAGTQVNDPIVATAKCKVSEPMSSGSYIYHWPEKYDQVFWPLTDENGIWFCAESGFTAFIDDFKDIPASEKKLIAVYLKENYKGEKTIEAKLKLLEGVYSLRKKDYEFENRLLRVLARWYQNLGNVDTANAYRKRALQGIQLHLQTNLSEARRLEYLYVAANYSSLFGDIQASEKFLTELKQAIEQLKDKKLSGFAKYLSELAKETPQIKPGERLDPKPDIR